MPFKDPQRKREYLRQWRKLNPEKKRASNKKYFDSHREQGLARLEKWAIEHPEQNRTRHHRYHMEHKFNPHYKNAHAARERKRNTRIRLTVLTHYGLRCTCCGETTKEFLCIDHVNNNGSRHRKLVGAGAKFYCWVIKNDFPADLQILCYNCNMAKQFCGKCPHKKDESVSAQRGEAGEREIETQLGNCDIECAPF